MHICYMRAIENNNAEQIQMYRLHFNHIFIIILCISQINLHGCHASDNDNASCEVRIRRDTSIPVIVWA